MKSLLFLIQFLLGLSAFAQNDPKFVLTANGVEHVAVSFENMTGDALYSKAMKWVESKYGRRDVIAVQPHNQIKVLSYWGGGYNLLSGSREPKTEYLLTIDVQDQQMKLTFAPGTVYSEGLPFTMGIPLFDYHRYFNEKGELKPNWADEKLEDERTMNELAKSLCDYIRQKEEYH